MATPVIVVDSATGNDANSGAGPGDGYTAGSVLSGTAASWSSLTFTLDGSPDLSSVATDGSHVIYVTTSTGRKFFTITAVNDGADTVTVAEAIAGTTTGLTWALGGKRAAFLSTGSTGTDQLWKNGGDILDGWVIELADGHSESSTSRHAMYGGGRWTLRGEAGATTRPKIVQDATASFAEISLNSGMPRGTRFKDFDICAGVTGASTPIHGGNNTIILEGIHFYGETGTDDFASGMPVITDAGNGSQILNCTFENFDGVAIDGSGTTHAATFCVTGCFFKGNSTTTSIGLDASASNPVGARFNRNVFSTVNVGIKWASSREDGLGFAAYIGENSFYNIGDDAIYISSATSLAQLVICNNIFSTVTGNGIAINDTLANTNNRGTIRNNAFYSITGNQVDPTGMSTEQLSGSITLTGDPFTSASTDDFSLNDTASAGAACQEVGWPTALLGV